MLFSELARKTKSNDTIGKNHRPGLRESTELHIFVETMVVRIGR